MKAGERRVALTPPIKSYLILIYNQAECIIKWDDGYISTLYNVDKYVLGAFSKDPIYLEADQKLRDLI